MKSITKYKECMNTVYASIHTKLYNYVWHGVQKHGKCWEAPCQCHSFILHWLYRTVWALASIIWFSNHFWHTVALRWVIRSLQACTYTEQCNIVRSRTKIHALSRIWTHNPVYEHLTPTTQTVQPLDWQILLLPSTNYS